MCFVIPWPACSSSPCGLAAGGAEKCAGLCVLIGTGLQSASMGMAGYATKPMQISRLTAPQVSRLMTSALVSANDGLTSQQADDILGHDSMRVQLKLLMGLPGFMDTGLQVLCTKLKNGSVPQNDLDIRSAGFAIMDGLLT